MFGHPIHLLACIQFCANAAQTLNLIDNSDVKVYKLLITDMYWNLHEEDET